MRNSDPVENPIVAATTCWFGGGRRGPSQAERNRQAQEQAAAQQAAARQAEQMRQQQAQAQAQAAAQAQAQRQQMALLEKQRQDAIAAQNAQMEEMKRQAELNKPAPAAQVDNQGSAESPGSYRDTLRSMFRRRGMRRSILAGESNQAAPMTTGESTLG